MRQARSTGSGLAIGLFSTGLTYLVFKNWIIGAVFGVSIFINLFLAALFGTLIPIALKRLKLDPALASGILVTMLTDVMGLMVFLGLATLMLQP